jgi:hypothetical protein
MSPTTRRSRRLATLFLVGAATTVAACDGRADRGRAENATAAASSGFHDPSTGSGQAPSTDAAMGAAADGSRRALLKVGAPELEQGAVGAPAVAPKPQTLQSQASATAPMQLPGSEALSSPMLIRTGSASVQVDSLGEGIARVRELARRVGALVANTSVSAGEERPRAATIELRIPGERFDDVVNGLSPLGKLESVNVQVEDVGEEYTDIGARVANARRLEARLVELLASRTGRLSDVLAVERELARVREEIERYEGRLRYLRTRASYSSLSVTVHERLPIVSPPGHHPIREALRQAWRNFVAMSAALIASLGVLVPVGVLAGGAWWVLRRRRRVSLTTA